MNAFDLITDQEKLEIIIKLEFSYSLSQLERYLNMTGWLRQYMKKYAQKAEPLQKRKTELLKLSPATKGAMRKRYSERTILQIC
jgi:hypothetical protein